MSNTRTTPDIIKAILKKCGELTDGTSGYADSAVEYLNDVYRGVLSGGNEFGVDVADPWAWALARRPIILTLQPPYESSATLTSGSTVGTLSVAPTISLTGWRVKFEGRDEYFNIQSHTAGTTGFSLDQSYTEATGLIAFRAIKTDYDLVDDTIIIDETNNVIDFKESVTALTATLVKGVYTPIGFAAHVSNQMMSATGATGIYNHSWNPIQRIFTWIANIPFSLLLGSGPNAAIAPTHVMGLDINDYSGTNIYVSSYSLNAINRLVAPMQIYRRQGSVNRSAPESGKIYEIDYNTFMREYPSYRTSNIAPDRYCVTRQRSNGIVTVRFNGYVSYPSRVEVPFIPIHQDLTNYALSVPVLPLSFRSYLVFGASYFVLLDKSDNKADSFGGLAKAKLQAMQHHNRKELSLAGQQYGRLRARSK